MDNKFETVFKYTIIGIGLLGTTLYMFSFGPKYVSEKDRRAYHLEDRKTFTEERKAALERLQTCYVSSQKNYDNHWARACKSVSDASIETCVNSNVPIVACNAKFAYKPDCELPTYRATMSSKYLDDQKEECRMMYRYETSPVVLTDTGNR